MEVVKNIYTKVKQIFDFIFYNGLLVFLILAILSYGNSIMKGQDPTIFGYKPIYILTGSMQSNDPDKTINEKSIIITKRVDSDNVDEIKVGDVVTYSNYDMSKAREVNITHRVIDIDHDKQVFVAKGDGNLKEDWFETPEGMTSEIPLNNIKYKLAYRWNFVSTLVLMVTMKSKVAILYGLSFVGFVILLKLIHSSLYKHEYEIPFLRSKEQKEKIKNIEIARIQAAKELTLSDVVDNEENDTDEDNLTNDKSHEVPKI